MTGQEYNNQFSDEELATEIWKDIPEWEGYYQASNLGRIKSLERTIDCGEYYKTNKTKLLKPTRDKDGYFTVSFIKKGKMFHSAKVHQIILISFGFKRPNKLYVCCHKDGCRYNNRIGNLRWGTQAENVKEQGEQGRFTEGERSGQAILNNKKVLEIRELYKTGKYCQKEIGKMFEVSQATIGFIIRKATWKNI